MRGSNKPLRRSDYERICRYIRDAPRSPYDIRLECGLSVKEWDVRRPRMIALGLMREIDGKYEEVKRG